MLTIIAAVILIVVGAFIFTQGGKVLGPTLAATGAVILLVLIVSPARAHDEGQWNNDAALRDWYQALMQPDVPTASCCGESDAYFCDDYYARDGKAYCKITDDRPDEPRRRPHVEIGTEIEIPPYKLKFDKSNPTGHGIVFISRQLYVYCYVQAGGA